jgi:ADP-heptose:LPS heptosyltransferase
VTSEEGRRALAGYHPRLTRFHLYHRRFPGGAVRRRRLAAELARVGYQRAYVLETDEHYRALAAGAGAPISAIAGPSAGTHYSVRCMEAVEPTLPRPLARGWLTLPVSEAGRRAAAAAFAAHGVAGGERLVGLHLTVAESSRALLRRRRHLRERAWPWSAWAELAQRLRDETVARGAPVRVVVDVLPEERRLVAGFVERAGEAATVISEPPDFERYKASLAALALLVTPDTGPMHVAAAVGTPVVALFSGKSPDDCGPFVPAERRRMLRAEDIPGARPGLGLAAITPDAVLAACLELLAASAAGPRAR